MIDSIKSVRFHKNQNIIRKAFTRVWALKSWWQLRGRRDFLKSGSMYVWSRCERVFALSLAWPNRTERRRAWARFWQGSEVLPTEQTWKCPDSSVNEEERKTKATTADQQWSKRRRRVRSRKMQVENFRTYKSVLSYKRLKCGGSLLAVPSLIPWMCTCTTEIEKKKNHLRIQTNAILNLVRRFSKCMAGVRYGFRLCVYEILSRKKQNKTHNSERLKLHDFSKNAKEDEEVTGCR